MKKLRNFFRGTYLGLMLIFLYAPILVLMVFSFNGSKSMARWAGFSFKWYEALMHDSTIMNALIVTLSVAVISALVATFIGTFAAIGIHSMKKRPRAVVENISRLPMVNPDLVTGISFMMLFAAMGIKGSYTRMLIAHITFNIPYVIFSVMPKLRQSSNLLYEAAMDLGCTPIMAILKVVIPDIMPGIVSGFVLAFTLSLDDFVVSWFATDGIQNLHLRHCPSRHKPQDKRPLYHNVRNRRSPSGIHKPQEHKRGAGRGDPAQKAQYHAVIIPTTDFK